MTSAVRTPPTRPVGPQPARAPRAVLPALVAAMLVGLGLAPADATGQTQYRVVQPDGSVTFTDRPPPPPPAPGVTVTPLGRGAAASHAASPAAEPSLPAELRQAMQRHPVTLYTTVDCRTCDVARRYLQQRGVPYSERLVSPDEEAVAALQRQVGARTVPALTIGSQPLRGFAEADWTAYLDAAGYPRESRLPRGWTPPPATPLVPRPSAAPPAPPAPAAPAEPAPPPGTPRS
ncbi:MAG: glutaredoxin family protein [Rubrivivax sp.]